MMYSCAADSRTRHPKALVNLEQRKKHDCKRRRLAGRDGRKIKDSLSSTSESSGVEKDGWYSCEKPQAILFDFRRFGEASDLVFKPTNKRSNWNFGTVRLKDESRKLWQILQKELFPAASTVVGGEAFEIFSVKYPTFSRILPRTRRGRKRFEQLDRYASRLKDDALTNANDRPVDYCLVQSEDEVDNLNSSHVIGCLLRDMLGLTREDVLYWKAMVEEQNAWTQTERLNALAQTLRVE